MKKVEVKMNCSLFIRTVIVSIIYAAIINGDIQLKINFNSIGGRFKHFWKSTGLCPPDPKTEIHKFLLSDDEKLNLALIGGLPNKSIKYVRIHWLLNLIHMRSVNGSQEYNFTYLDALLDWVHDQKLYPGFEIMGTPIIVGRDGKPLKYDITFSNSRSAFYTFWYDIVLQIAQRYIERYGFTYTQKWRFETWNEPDLENYNVLNFTLRDYLVYARACRNALRDALEPVKSSFPLKRLKLGGPAGLFEDPKKHPLCWGLLRNCNKRKRRTCPIQFISFHKKGDGTAAQVLNKSLELLDLMHSKFPNLRRLPVANDEADILTNWSKSEEWRGDVRYAAMMVKVIIDHFKKVSRDLKLAIEVLSNDNGFLNYHPYYFTQRTLLTRFQMNNTNPAHIQFVKKPAYSVMGLLSLLGDEYLKEEAMPSDPLVQFLVTRRGRNKHKSQTTTLLITYVNNTEGNNKRIKRINAVFNNLPDFDSKYVIYVLDNLVTNPFLLWKYARSPVFPTKSLREQMRNVEEPFRHRGPVRVVNSTLEVQMNLTLPTVALIHVCSRSSQPPGRVTHLKAYNVTRNEVLLIWKDTKVYSKCIRTYEVEFEPECGRNSSKVPVFRRVNLRDTIFLSYHHVETGGSAGEATRGRYRVRAVDYWNTPGKYSKFLSYPVY